MNDKHEEGCEADNTENGNCDPNPFAFSFSLFRICDVIDHLVGVGQVLQLKHDWFKPVSMTRVWVLCSGWTIPYLSKSHFLSHQV